MKKLVAFLSALLLAACAGAPPLRDDTVRVGFNLEPTGLDPTRTAGVALDQVLADNVYEGLVSIDEYGDIHPRLATRWEVSDDGLTYVFTLARGVTFHDGTTMDEGDVVGSLNAARAPGSLNPDAAHLAGIDTVEAAGPGEVTITLSAPNLDILSALTTKAGYILPADHDADLARESNGTGPYRLGRWRSGSSIELRRNEEYWGEPPSIDTVVYTYYPDAVTAANALASGEIDLLTFTTPDMIERFEGDARITHGAGADPSLMILAFNHDHPALARPEVRRALRRAVDKDGLIHALGGTYTRVGGPATPAHSWFDPSLTDLDSFDPGAAREALAAAGATGLELTLTVPSHYDPVIGEYIAAELDAVGVRVTIETVDFATWLTSVYSDHDYDLTIILHVEDNTIANYANPDYYWGVDSPEFRDHLAEAGLARTAGERDEAMRQGARTLAESAAADWLYSPGSHVLASADLAGYPTNRVLAQFHVRDLRWQR